MQLSSSTIDILKNFSGINTGILVKPGKILRVLSPNKNVYAEAHVEEEFPQEFALYDLTKLLSVISLDKQQPPELSFDDKSLTVKLNNISEVNIRYCDPKIIGNVPNNIKFGNCGIKFSLSEQVVKSIFNVASILKCPHLLVEASANSNDFIVKVIDVKGEIVDSGNFYVHGETDKDFNIVLKMENLKIIPGPYVVEVTDRSAKFSHVGRSLIYVMGVEYIS